MSLSSFEITVIMFAVLAFFIYILPKIKGGTWKEWLSPESNNV